MEHQYQELFKLKSRFFTFLLVIAYTFLHIKLSMFLLEASPNKMFAFEATLPFGKRILTTLIAHTLTYIPDVSIEGKYIIIELIFVFFLFFFLQKLLRDFFTKRAALLLTWLFLLILPIITLLNYKFWQKTLAPLFYTYDTPELMFITLGMYLILRSKWLWFYLTLFVATINRETSLLLVLLIPALHLKNFNQYKWPLVISGFIYITVSLLLCWIFKENQGHVAEMYHDIYKTSIIQLNMYWLFNEGYISGFLYCFAGIPLFWFVFYDYIPYKFKPVRYVVLFSFLILMVVGRIDEPRIFGEMIILMYLPVCLGVKAWLTNEPIQVATSHNFGYFANRYAIIFILSLLIVSYTAFIIAYPNKIPTLLLK